MITLLTLWLVIGLIAAIVFGHVAETAHRDAYRDCYGRGEDETQEG